MFASQDVNDFGINLNQAVCPNKRSGGRMVAPGLRLLLTLAASAAAPSAAAAPAKMNVLLIVCDDLRPELGAYNHSHMLTPHMDALAKESLVFERAFTNYAYCCPSRNSFMSGLVAQEKLAREMRGKATCPAPARLARAQNVPGAWTARNVPGPHPSGACRAPQRCSTSSTHSATRPSSTAPGCPARGRRHTHTHCRTQSDLVLRRSIRLHGL